MDFGLEFSQMWEEITPTNYNNELHRSSSFWLLTLSCTILTTHILLLPMITSQSTTCTKILSQTLPAGKPEVLNQDNVNSLERSSQSNVSWMIYI